jgi:hypothetical protein
MRQRGKVDQNQAEIVRRLRSLGASVAILSSLGNGVPDVLVGLRGRNVLMEIKDGSKPKSAQRLTSAEQTFQQQWAGQYAIVRNVAEAIEVMNREVDGL